jgi:hypothetical protein
MLAAIAKNWRMELLSRDVEPQASITLRPKGGIRMRLRAAAHLRAAAANQTYGTAGA